MLRGGSKHKNRGKAKKTRKVFHEVFRSPAWIYRDLYDKYPQLFTGRMIDPSAGDGRMVKELRQRGNKKQHLIIDIRPEEKLQWKKNKLLKRLGPSHCLIGDFLKIKDTERLYDVMLTNPPFTITLDILTQGYKWVKKDGHLIFLQRLNWLGTFKRSKLFKKEGHLKYVLILPKRPVWEIDGREDNKSDTYEYAWFVFQRSYVGLPTVDWLL